MKNLHITLNSNKDEIIHRKRKIGKKTKKNKSLKFGEKKKILHFSLKSKPKEEEKISKFAKTDKYPQKEQTLSDSKFEKRSNFMKVAAKILEERFGEYEFEKSTQNLFKDVAVIKSL